MTEKTHAEQPEVIQLRPPHQVMRLSRLGSFHQTRLSFMRVLLRRIISEGWSFKRSQWQVDQRGVGHAVYMASGPDHSYSLIAFAHDLDPSLRSDRVIAEAWDATFTLFDGVPTSDDVARLKENVPLQEAGRISDTELSLSRANRSVRLFDYVRKSLAAGKQPEQARLDEIGYLMRTTAVYGSGKFGAVDRHFVADRPELAAPFQAELLAVYMIRQFSIDIVEHLARCDNPEAAVPLAASLARGLGIGNSTGLGMAPFLVNHPTLLNNWILARETALARIRSVAVVEATKVDSFRHYLTRQIVGVLDWTSEHEYQKAKVSGLRDDLMRLSKEIDRRRHNRDQYFWNSIYQWAERTLTEEGQECVVTLLLEIYPELTDELADTLSIDENASFKIDGTISVGQLHELIQDHYGFALSNDYTQGSQQALFWYASEEKLEPRLGRRFEEPGADREHPLAIARDIASLAKTITAIERDKTIAEFLLLAPQYRHVVRRILQIQNHPYAEIADNLIADGMLPIDLLRCKLAFFGAVKFDPRSDRWLRITLFQHAPLVADLDELRKHTRSSSAELLMDSADSWVYPPCVSNAD